MSKNVYNLGNLDNQPDHGIDHVKSVQCLEIGRLYIRVNLDNSQSYFVTLQEAQPDENGSNFVPCARKFPGCPVFYILSRADELGLEPTKAGKWSCTYLVSTDYCFEQRDFMKLARGEEVSWPELADN